MDRIEKVCRLSRVDLPFVFQLSGSKVRVEFSVRNVGTIRWTTQMFRRYEARQF